MYCVGARRETALSRRRLERPWTKTGRTSQQEAARPIQQLQMETQNGNPGLNVYAPNLSNVYDTEQSCR